MKKTLLITTDFPPRHGGVAKYYSELFRGFQKDSIHILAQKEQDSSVFDHTYPHHVIRRDFFTRAPVLFPKWTTLFWHLDRLVKRYDMGRICVGQVLPIGHVARLSQRFYTLPYYVFTHGMDIAQEMTPRRKSFVEDILESAHGVIANSEFTAQILRVYKVPSEKILVLTPCPAITPNVLNSPPSFYGGEKSDLSDSPPSLEGGDKEGDSKTILFVGRLVKRKGADMLIEALKKIDDPTVQLVIAGEGPEEQSLRELAKKHGLENSVQFHIAPTDSELARLYDQCDIVCVPARDIKGDIEGFGMFALEAGAFGKPVIAGRCGGQLEAVIDEGTGLLVNSEDVNDIAHALRRLLNDVVFRARLGDAGQARVEKEFQWKDRAKQLQNFFTERE